MSIKIRIDNLTKIFGRRQQEALALLSEGGSKDRILADTGCVIAVDRVSLEISEGEIFMVMGLSGSGKSTLVRCLNRLIEPTAGEVYLDGESIFAKSERELREIRRHRVSMVFQNFALLPHRTTLENVEFGLKIRGEPQAQRQATAHEILRLVGLEGWAEHYPEVLSGGMKQRLGLARALANDPDILLMDEPFSALDPLIRQDMQEELLALQQRLKKTIVFITHDFQEALKLGDRIAVMKDGAFVQVGTPEEIVGAPSDDYVLNFAKAADRGQVFSVASVMQPARTICLEGDGATPPGAAADDGRQDLIVVDSERLPLGLIRAADMGNAGVNGARILAGLVSKEIAVARHDARLAELYGLCAAGEIIAVVDDAGRVVGQITARDVLRRIAVEPGGGPT